MPATIPIRITFLPPPAIPVPRHRELLIPEGYLPDLLSHAIELLASIADCNAVLPTQFQLDLAAFKHSLEEAARKA